jgi:hypothetical protein
MHGGHAPTIGDACCGDHSGGLFSHPETIRGLVCELSRVDSSCGTRWTHDGDEGRCVGTSQDWRGHGSVGCFEENHGSHHGQFAPHHC